MNLEKAKINESLSLVNIIKRNIAEGRIRANGDTVDVIYSQAVKQNIDAAMERLELSISSLTPAQQEEELPVQTLRLPENSMGANPAEPAPAPEAVQPPKSRSRANAARDKEISNMLNSQKHIPAVGVNRDTTSRTVEVMHPFVQAPESEDREYQELLPEIPGTNTRPVSPYQRLTGLQESEMLRLFAQSPFLPDAIGHAVIPTDISWHRDYDVMTMSGYDIVRLPTAAYGLDKETGGPEFVILRLGKAAVLWNFKKGPENIRIFYIGRSNITGYWLTPKQLTIQEQVSVIVGLVEFRNRLKAQKDGVPYEPVARVRD